jgi:hypothetical protein
MVLKRIISAVKGVEFVSDIMSHIILRGHWCLNIHAPADNKIDDVKDSFYKGLKSVRKITYIPYENSIR